MADKRVVEPENLSASADAPEAEGAEQTATTEAKEQLAALTRERDDYYDRLPDEIKELGVMVFAGCPPPASLSPLPRPHRQRRLP